MATFTEIGLSMSKIDYKKAIFDAFDNSDFTEIQLMITDRLYRYGVTANGEALKTNKAGIGGTVYSKYTIKEKQKKGQPANRVTLNDTCEFYRTFKTKLQKKGISITAWFQKDESNIYDNFTKMYSSFTDFTNDIAGLTDDEKKELFTEILIERIQKNVLIQFENEVKKYR